LTNPSSSRDDAPAMTPVNGAHALLATLEANGVTTCFANPGTSEMHFVAGLDDVRAVHAILCLFEGVATGAADGYARVTRRPAATLLHLGPGLANGWANLHNARRAHVPLLNIIGDHATYHGALDAPLQSDIRALASALDGWTRTSTDSDHVASDVADALHAAYGPPGQVATLILPADVSWNELTTQPAKWPVVSRPPLIAPSEHELVRAIDALRSKRTAILVGGATLDAEQLNLAERIAVASSSKFLVETFPAIMERGVGIASPERLIYVPEFAAAQLQDIDALVVLGARDPVSFFAYPNVPSALRAPTCDLIDIGAPGTDTLSALTVLADALGPARIPAAVGDVADAPSGELTTQSLAAAIAATLPDDCVVSDESNTAGVHFYGATRFAPRHSWMTLTGGAIGMGLPLALGAAVGSGRRVLALEADGSMMYTLQALWTMARESLDVTVVGLSNRSYAILNFERQRVGAIGEGSAGQRLLDIDDPTLDLCALASAQGVPSVRVTTAEELVEALRRSYATPGPMFIEAVLPKGLI
jgi:acetolactate synthase-1/2/3 large subunit